MKSKMIQVLLILLCLLGYKLSAAQDYVLTTKGDTITGTVKYINYQLEKKVQVAPLTGKKIVYSILQTREFRMRNEVYRPVRTRTEYTFMKLLKSGYLSLYAAQAENQMTWDVRYLVKKDGTSLELPNISFKKLVTNFLEDCESVVRKIESGELNRQKLDPLIDEYNACIDQRTGAQPIAQSVAKPEKNASWNELKKAVDALTPFDQKSDALDMIREVQSKIERSEKVPAFLVSGLKEALKDQPVKEELQKALDELN